MITLELPYPISANRYWRTFRGRQVVSKEGKAYRKECAQIAMLYGAKPYSGEFSMSLCLHPRTNKDGSASRVRLDLDNTWKVALDSLNKVAYEDDKQLVRQFGVIGKPIDGGGLTIRIRYF